MLSTLSVYVPDEHLTKVKVWLVSEPEDFTMQRLSQVHHQLDKVFLRWDGTEDTLHTVLTGMDHKINVWPYPYNLYLHNPTIMGIRRQVWFYYKTVKNNLKTKAVEIIAYLYGYLFIGNILKITVKVNISPIERDGPIWRGEQQ